MVLALRSLRDPDRTKWDKKGTGTKQSRKCSGLVLQSGKEVLYRAV